MDQLEKLRESSLLASVPFVPYSTSRKAGKTPQSPQDGTQDLGHTDRKAALRSCAQDSGWPRSLCPLNSSLLAVNNRLTPTGGCTGVHTSRRGGPRAVCGAACHPTITWSKQADQRVQVVQPPGADSARTPEGVLTAETQLHGLCTARSTAPGCCTTTLWSSRNQTCNRPPYLQNLTTRFQGRTFQCFGSSSFQARNQLLKTCMWNSLMQSKSFLKRTRELTLF